MRGVRKLMHPKTMLAWHVRVVRSKTLAPKTLKPKGLRVAERFLEV